MSHQSSFKIPLQGSPSANIGTNPACWCCPAHSAALARTAPFPAAARVAFDGAAIFAPSFRPAPRPNISYTVLCVLLAGCLLVLVLVPVPVPVPVCVCACVRVCDSVYARSPWGHGPNTGQVVQDKTFEGAFPGNYLRDNYPDIDYWKSCRSSLAESSSRKEL